MVWLFVIIFLECDYMKVIYSMESIEIEGKSIFLAGPIPRDENAVSWKREALNILEEHGFLGTVFVPEAREFVPKVDYMDEVMWDKAALDKCDLIIFWVPRKRPYMLGLTTNVEFGYYIGKKDIIYGRPNTADDIVYLDWLYKEETGKVIYDNLEDLLIQSINILK